MTTHLSSVFWYDVAKEKHTIRGIIRFMLAAYRIYFLEAPTRFPSGFVTQFQTMELRPGFDDNRMDVTPLSQFLFRMLGRFETDRLYYRSVTLYVRIVYFSATRFSADTMSPACFNVELAYAPAPVALVEADKEKEKAERASSIDDWTIVSPL
jgi:hypothetical protein